MDRCKDILCQIFGKSPISDEKDVAQNIYTHQLEQSYFCCSVI